MKEKDGGGAYDKVGGVWFGGRGLNTKRVSG